MNEKPSTKQQAQALHRAKSQLEAELGGKTIALSGDSAAIWLVWHHNGMLDLGGTCPKERVPELLRELADRLEGALNK